MHPTTVETLGRALAAARLSDAQLPAGVADIRRIGSEADAAAVQDAAGAALRWTQRGYSIAATSDLTARLLNCWEPIVAPLFAERVLPGGASLRLSRSVLGAGAQFAFVVGRSYPESAAEALTAATARTAVVSCYLALQVLSRRVPHDVPLNGWTATADFGLDAIHVQGPFVDRWDEHDLAACPIGMELDGHVVAQGSGRDVRGDPLEVVAWLAGRLARRGRRLVAGDIVATGSCTGLAQVVPGQHLRGTFGGLGCADLLVV